MRVSGGGGNFLSPNNEDLENGTAKPCHPEERSDVGIASSLKNWLTNKRNGLIASSPYSPIALKTKTAFTLAEVLITLGIIGIVAALTLPAFISNVQGRIQAKRVENIKQKLSKVTDKMAVQNGLIGYPDTMSFVQEMSKHMKLAKICDNDHLSDCWPTEEVLLNDEGETWQISKTKSAQTLNIVKEKRSSWADTVAIVTADGVPMILSYKKDCDFNPDISGLNFDKATALSNSTSCLSGVFDWNGGENPNKLAKIDGNTKGDILPFGDALGLGTECTIQIGSKCFTGAKTIEKPLSKAECEEKKGELNISSCYHEKDYWAGAVAMCGGTDKMPTIAELGQLASILYKEKPKVGATQDVQNLTLDNAVATSMGFSASVLYSDAWAGCVWSGQETVSHRAFARRFSLSGTAFLNWFGRGMEPFWVICSGD